MDDLISRQAAIEALREVETKREKHALTLAGVRLGRHIIADLPPAQPSAEYKRGWEDGRRALREEIWEDGRD